MSESVPNFKDSMKIALDLSIAIILKNENECKNISFEISKLSDDELQIVLGAIAGLLSGMISSHFTNMSERELRRTGEMSLNKVYKKK